MCLSPQQGSLGSLTAWSQGSKSGSFQIPEAQAQATHPHILLARSRLQGPPRPHLLMERTVSTQGEEAQLHTGWRHGEILPLTEWVLRGCSAAPLMGLGHSQSLTSIHLCEALCSAGLPAGREEMAGF